MSNSHHNLLHFARTEQTLENRRQQALGRNKGDNQLEQAFPRLDAPTLALSVALLATVLATVSFTLSRANLQLDSALTMWSRSMACVASTCSLWFLTGYWPFFFTFLLANMFSIAATPLGILALARLFEVRAPIPALWVTTAFGLSGVMGTYFLGTSRGIAIFSMSMGLAVQLAILAFMIQQNFKKQTASIGMLSVVATSGLAITHASRALTAAIGDFATVVPTNNSATQIGYLFSLAIFLSASSIAFFAMSNDKSRREAIERLRRDGLTGLYTRTAFFEMEAEIEKMGSREGYALMMVDVDHFKSINDTFGHSGGDIVLAHVGRLIAGAFRLSDIAVRYGGEEFCVVLRGCNESDAAQFAQRLVREARSQGVRLSDGQSTQFTLSVGYACRPAGTERAPHVESLHDVIARADQALYRAKREGRNQAVAAFLPGSMASILV
jgi:diguanylate cyclase (GGDEF)-like protein